MEIYTLIGCLPAVLMILTGIALLIIGTVNLNAQANKPGAKSVGEVKEEFSRLKAQFDAHALSEAQFKARLQELMVQDAQGRWWMIGYETGQWYVHDGQRWNPGQPDAGVESTPQVIEARKKAIGKARSMRLVGLIILVAGTLWGCIASSLLSSGMSNSNF